jgi:hypothetical protein
LRSWRVRSPSFFGPTVGVGRLSLGRTPRSVPPSPTIIVPGPLKASRSEGEGVRLLWTGMKGTLLTSKTYLEVVTTTATGSYAPVRIRTGSSSEGLVF